MSQYRGRFWKLSAGCSKSLSGVALALALSACGKQRDIPTPPQSPPKPVTSNGYLTTAHFVVPARPRLPSAGFM
jgi:hypothetical protein